ncbi:MAG: hypothetical protein ABI367_13815 [Mucilaginibacter sp.]
MRLILFICFCTLTFSASAQFWKKKQVRYPQLQEASYISATTISPATVTLTHNVRLLAIKHPDHSLDIAEEIILKEVKHNMRYRVYDEASYSFTELAHLYVLEHRFSEAKWFLLQSNNLAKQQNNDKLTIANLLDLAAIKASIGELALARTDLKEAHDLAALKGLKESLNDVEQTTKDIELKNTTGFIRAGLRYAAAVEANKND